MDERFIKGTVCGIENCRSKRYERGEDGFVYCQRGHRQGGLVRGEDDENDGDFLAIRKVTRRQRDDDESSVHSTKSTKTFTGPRGVDLYLKCVQLILRHQLWFLIHEKGLPTELEKVVFDLWTLRITQFGDKIASEDTDSEPGSQSRRYNTQDSADSDSAETEGGLVSRLKNRNKKLVDRPNLYDCLALCYLGILTLRLPITPGDLSAWTTDDKMEFRRAIRCVPLEMRDRLSASYQVELEPNTFVDYEKFYRTMTRLQMSYEKDHGILWPPLNIPTLLFRYIKDLALPLELYNTTIQLGEFLGLDFTLHYEKNKRLGLRHYPEAQLVGCLAVCVKLLYPFDSITRKYQHPESSSEPAGLKINWDVWRSQMHGLESTEDGGEQRFTRKDLMTVNEEDVFSMPLNQMDQYLDFYTDAFLDEAAVQRATDNIDFLHALYELFPIRGTEEHPTSQVPDRTSHEQSLKKVVTVQQRMKLKKAYSMDKGPGPLRPGDNYLIWKEEKDMPENARTFYEEVAKLAGLSLDMLIMTVFFTESRVEQWRRKEAKREKGAWREEKARRKEPARQEEEAKRNEAARHEEMASQEEETSEDEEASQEEDA